MKKTDKRTAQNITLDASTWSLIDRAAKKVNLKRSGFIEQVILGNFPAPGAK